jgi:hypothetical protein
MPDIPPKTHHFTCYVTYLPGSDEPELIVYPRTTEINSDELFRLSELGALEASLTVTRRLTEDVRRWVAPSFQYAASNAPVQAALGYLDRTRPELLREYLKNCWELADGNFNRYFPTTFPRGSV